MARLVPLLVLGYGTVGRGVLASLRARASSSPGVDVRVCIVGTRGLRAAAPARAHRARAAVALACLDHRAGVVAEVMGGTSAARCAMRAAGVRTHTPLVTANKALLACYGTEACRRAVLADAAVAGGLPIVAVAHRCTPAARMANAAGVLNSTANWVLTCMCRYCLPLRRALLEAYARGYAEADCACDVDGSDAAQKLAVLGSWAPGVHVRPRSLYAEGVRRVRSPDCACARALGLDVKLLSLVSHAGTVRGQVRPFMASARCPAACCDGVTNAVFLDGEHTGGMWLYGRGAGMRPTAAAVCSDVNAAARSAASGELAPLPAPRRLSASARMRGKYYLRAGFDAPQDCRYALSRCMRIPTVTARLVHASGRAACVAVLEAAHERNMRALVAGDAAVRSARFLMVVL
ncbi:Homoserine dehydrogenase [Candidatus Tremblaya princeps]|uniref:Homoserine dehydrogenase n=1 Tax=Tremblaya princeps TaxID=189385 RepID=A0A143WNF7_TREPR|nr:Homoserine dehydrogenase [Candidatus Tremblaya princeps]